eukprot:jgi/Psemu1/254700/estExt_Genewise1Plus.C_1080064
MAFSFGSATPAPAAAAPAPAFSFGGSTPAPAAAAPAPSAFSFGGATPAPAAAAPAPSAFSFGGAAPAPGAGAPAPAPSAFSFGAAPAPAAGAPATTAAPAPSAFSFGSAAPTATPAPVTASTGAGSASVALVGTMQTTLTAPDFDARFENLDLWKRIRKLCNETIIQQQQQQQATNGTMSLAGQDLARYISTHADTTLKPKVVEWTPPNNTLRQQLAQNPNVAFGSSTSTTTLTAATMEQIGLLSTELRISEADAITLYVEAARDYDILHGLLTSRTADGGGGFVDQALPGAKYDNVAKLTRDFYFYERHLKLETILYLVEQRMHNNPDVIRATDSLLKDGQLVATLISVIREYTQRIEQLQQEVRTHVGHNGTATMGNPAMGIPGGIQQLQGQPQQGTANQFAKVHLLFCTQERQAAAEALVFIAYHTQLELKELTALLDLIRDLSAKTPKLSPFKDVPSPYESSSLGNNGMDPHYNPYGGSAPWPPSTANRKEKDPLVWQEELVRKTSESGQPKLLQCYSLLVVAAMAAMETRQVLYDRELHAPNDFGRGNQLLHPSRPSLENIKELHDRLKPEAHEQWTRPDVWGLLACSYALLLRMTPTAITSPTKGGSNSLLSKEVREAAIYCMEIPAELMSYTFCRLTLIPSLEKVQSASMRTMCDVSEFCLSVVSETYSLYLNVLSEGTGNLPISRKRWQIREEEGLKLQKEQYVEQAQLDYYLGKTSPQQPKIPTSVDLMKRHECLDDLIALATTLCSLGPDYSRMFWAKDKKTNGLVPSRPLQECMVQASQDSSLIPYVHSWMAALSNDEESAKAIHAFMSGNKNNVEGITQNVTSWYGLVHSLRYYVQELSNNNDTNVSKQSSSTMKNSTKSNTSYYYGLEDNVMPDQSNGSQSSGARNPSSSSSSSSKKSMKPLELSQESKLQLASYLALITNVSLHSFEARYKILSTVLPLVEGDLAAGGDECLVVLFKLAIAPLCSKMRGATLSTIASLLQPTDGIQDPEVKTFMEEQANNAWEYLESCSLFPINMFDRYRVVPAPGTDVQDQAGMSFPPSSMALASLAGRVDASLPKHATYGILFEMEHIESKKGWYPSTEGLLELLKSLVSSVGCPSNLGQNWRVRTGCTPYVEYVIHFVIPKALGVNNHTALPFRVPGDRSRLVSRALAVVEAVIIRYNLSQAVRLHNIQTRALDPLSVLGIQAVVDQVHMASDKVDMKGIMNDFKSMTAPATLLASDANNLASGPGTNQSFGGPSAVSRVPVPKSPGFTILVELLSSFCGDLLKSLAVILTECGGPNGILPVFRDESDKMDMTYALYGSTPPDLLSAKEGVKENGPTKPLQNLLKPFSPKFQTANIDDHYVDNSVTWREKAIASALHILCAAAAREDALIAALMAAKEQPLKLVPVIEFRELKPGSGISLAIDTKAKDVKVSRLTDLLCSIQDARFLRSTIVEYIGYDAVSKAHSTEISAAALSIVYRMQQTMSAQTALSSLNGDEATANGFSKAIAHRLLISSRSLDSLRDSEILKLILNWILSELRLGVIANDGLAQVLLGLPGDATDGNWQPGCGHYSGAITDCFDAILDIIGHDDMSNGFSGISSLCFEIFFRLHDLINAGDPMSLKVVIYTAERLRGVDFWRENISRMPFVDFNSMSREQMVQNLHSMGWLLKGAAHELRLLAGYDGDAISKSKFSRYLEQHPAQCNLLLSSLYGSDTEVIQKLVRSLPLELMLVDPNLPHPAQEALRVAVCDLPGALEIVQGYQILDCKKVISVIRGTPQAMDIEIAKKWIDEYNFIANWNCAVSHLTSAMGMLVFASLYSAESISRCHTSILESSNFSDSWLQHAGPRDLLLDFLRSLDFSTDHQGLDSFLIPVATRNLSNIVLNLSEFITSDANEDSTNSSDLLQLAALLANIIHASSIGNDTAEEAAVRYERTVSLASALVLLLRSSASVEPGFAAQYRDDFIRAAHGLSNISCFKVDSSQDDAHGTVSILARGCLSSIVHALGHIESDSLVEKSYACSCISQTFLERSISLVADLDEDICNFLQDIALQPSGAKLLIDAGIDRALLCAARRYKDQEKNVVQDLEKSSSGFSKTTIRTPGFCLGHLKLICALLAASDLSEELAMQFASRCIEIIGVYETNIERLCYEFPTQADFLRWFLKALVMASSVAKPLKKKNHLNRLGTDNQGIVLPTRFFDNGIAMLLEQLSENPLPRDMLPDRIPRELKNLQDSLGSKVVSVQKDNSSTWWDVLKSVLATRADASNIFPAPIGHEVLMQTPMENWSEDTFEYSIVAGDILWLGLKLLRRTEQLDLFNGLSLARGLFFCTFAAKTVGARLEKIRAKVSCTTHSMDTDENFGTIELELEYLTLLASSLEQSVEQLLMLCLQVCDSRSNGNELVLKQILATIESSGINKARFGVLSDKRSEFVRIVCDEIKKLCKGI